MSGTPNYKFSIAKGRQVSFLEAGVDSIRRRFSNSIGGRMTAAGVSKLSRAIRRMPRNRERYEAESGDKTGSGTDSGHRIRPGQKSNNNGTRTTNENGKDFGYYDEKRNSSGDQHNGEDSESISNPNLSPFTEATDETLQKILAAHDSIGVLSKIYTKYMDDIEDVHKIRERCAKLEEACQRQRSTIFTLRDMSHEKKEEFAKKEEEIEYDKKVLEAEMQKFEKQKELAEKRAKAQEAEQRSRQDKELEKLKAEQDKKYENQKQKLEQGLKKQEADGKKKLTDLEADKKSLSDQLTAQTVQIKELETKLKEGKDEFDVLKRAKDSYKDETERISNRLQMIEREFALSSNTTDYYKKNFNRISRDIENMSSRYFNDLNPSEFDNIRDKLTQADQCFASVPISDSEDSQNLCSAHAYRVISSSLYKNIWQPFSSDKTMPRPDFVALLGEIANELARSGPDGTTSGRLSSVWRALTTRALKSLSDHSATSPQLTSQSRPPSPPRNRSEKAINDIFDVLSPLVVPSQVGELRNELIALVNRAISLWHIAQTDELKITISPTLDLANREEWRYAKFDPLPGDGKKVELVPKTRPRIFTLFPRVTATQIVLPTAEPTDGLPGGWPQPRDEPRTIHTCIHTGLGLPEWSLLVVRGKEEEEDTREELRRRIEKAKQEVNSRSTRRSGGHSRRESMVGSSSGPPSPVSQLKIDGGLMKEVAE